MQNNFLTCSSCHQKCFSRQMERVRNPEMDSVQGKYYTWLTTLDLNMPSRLVQEPRCLSSPHISMVPTTYFGLQSIISIPISNKLEHARLLCLKPVTYKQIRNPELTKPPSPPLFRLFLRNPFRHNALRRMPRLTQSPFPSALRCTYNLLSLMFPYPRLTSSFSRSIPSTHNATLIAASPKVSVLVSLP